MKDIKETVPLLIARLLKAGHSLERAKEIIKEAEKSSNPAYILNYWGVKTS